MHAKSKTADLIALGVVAAIGVPLVWMAAAAFAEGESRRHEMPVRALIGSRTYDALLRGEQTEQHYMGDDRRAPDFALPTRDGGTWRLSQHRGKVIVLNFWSVTCQPCLEEMPSLVSLANILEDRDDIELVTINADRSWDDVRRVRDGWQSGSPQRTRRRARWWPRSVFRRSSGPKAAAPTRQGGTVDRVG